MLMDFQISYLIFVRSTKEGNFNVESFIFDMFSYARWLSLYLFGLMKVETIFQILLKIGLKVSSPFKIEQSVFCK